MSTGGHAPLVLFRTRRQQLGVRWASGVVLAQKGDGQIENYVPFSKN